MNRRFRERILVLHASRRSFARGALAALEGAGYRLVPAGRRMPHGSGEPDARIVCPRSLRRLRSEQRTPLVLVDGRRDSERRPPADPRVVATLARPATLLDLYRALQLALEPDPRRVPRVRTTLPARLRSGDDERPGAIVSLSEGGALVRSARPLASRRRMRLWFPLPERGLLEVCARPIYERAGHIGVAFLDLERGTREAIAQYVGRALGDAS